MGNLREVVGEGLPGLQGQYGEVPFTGNQTAVVWVFLIAGIAGKEKKMGCLSKKGNCLGLGPVKSQKDSEVQGKYFLIALMVMVALVLIFGAGAILEEPEYGALATVVVLMLLPYVWKCISLTGFHGMLCILAMLIISGLSACVGYCISQTFLWAGTAGVLGLVFGYALLATEKVFEFSGGREGNE